MRRGFLRRLRPLSAARSLWCPLFLIQEAWSKAGCSGHCGGPTLLAGPPIPLPLVGLLRMPHNCTFSGGLFSADKSWMALRPWLVTGGQGLTQGRSLCLKVAVVLVMPISLPWDQAEGSCQAETTFLPAFFFFFLMWTIFKVFIDFVTIWFFGHGACGILAPQPGIEPALPALEGNILTTGPPGKSPCQHLTPALSCFPPSLLHPQEVAGTRMLTTSHTNREPNLKMQSILFLPPSTSPGSLFSRSGVHDLWYLRPDDLRWS